MHGPVPQLQDFLEQAAAHTPERLGLVCETQRLSYREIDRRANALAHRLVERGVKRGDRVVVFLGNVVDAAVAFWAVLKANAVVSIVNAATKSEKLAYYLDDCRATALITGEALRGVWEAPVAGARSLKATLVSPDALFQETAAAPPARRNIDIDLAALIYTSGSTGDPKGVMLTHRNMLTAATSISSYLRMQNDDVILCVLPLAFDYGLYQMIMSFRVGATLVLEPSFTFPGPLLAAIAREGVTGFPGVPTVFAVLASLRGIKDQDFSKIRFVTNTAAALPVKHILFLRELFPKARIYSMYGLTECKRCTYLPPEDLERKPESVGIAIPNTEMWIVDDKGERVGPNQVGQLVIRGATVMKGYWEKPESTAKRLKPGPIPGEQVLYTGDYCKMDEEGYLYFVGRMDDIIKSRGEKVAPKEVESVLCNIEGVREAAVIGVPDELLGQAVKAFVVLDEGASLTVLDLQRACEDKLEPFMLPRYIEMVRSLPRTSTGKIKKTDLK